MWGAGTYNGSVGEDVVNRVARTISRYAMFGPGEKIGIAVSGGADSVALLHCLFELAPSRKWTLVVLHLNHCLRGAESAGDAAFVRELATALALPCRMGRIEVKQLAAETGDNLEQAARRARYEFLGGFIESGEVGKVALGHTLSDQAETVLFRLLRGTGTTGLAGIRPVTGDGFLRPLIEVDRTDVLEYLRSRGIEWREDSSNSDPRYDRNRIRHTLLPLLRREWNPALPEILARMATVAQSEEAYWTAEMNRLAPEYLLRRDSAVLLRADQFKELPRAVTRRLIRHAVEQVKGDLRSIGFIHIEQVIELMEASTGDGGVSLPGLRVTRSHDWLRLAPPESSARPEDYSIRLTVPGRFPIPGSATELRLELIPGKHTDPVDNTGYNTKREDRLNLDRISQPLELRNWKPGDRFRPAGSSSVEKMKTLFQRERIPSWDRRGWPIITCGNTVVWSRRFGAAEGFVALPGSKRAVRVFEAGVER